LLTQISLLFVDNNNINSKPIYNPGCNKAKSKAETKAKGIWVKKGSLLKFS